MKIVEIEQRMSEIAAECQVDGADLDALKAEAQSLSEERAAKLAEIEQRKAAEQQALKSTAVIAEFKNENEVRKMSFAIDSIEYRDAWVKTLCKKPVTEEERSALASAGAVIPTMTVNAVYDKLVKAAPMMGKVDVSQFPSYVRFPVATTNNAASAGAVGGTITESSDVVGYIDLTPNEYVKLLTVGADIEHMAVDAIHAWIVDNLVGQIKAKIDSDIVVGSGTNCCKGITATVAADATNLPATLTKASLLKVMGTLGANYQEGAIWVMTPNLFYNEVMSLTALNDYVINDGFSFRLFGHEVVLKSECLVSSKETILYGDPKAYKLNIFKAIEVKPFETATTTNLQFRGCTMADGELADANAFVRFAKA